MDADDERCYALSDYYINEIEKKVNVNNGREMLIEILDSISEIAEILGFSGVSYFSKVFHQVMGFSPSKYIIHNVPI